MVRQAGVFHDQAEKESHSGKAGAQAAHRCLQGSSALYFTLGTGCFTGLDSAAFGLGLPLAACHWGAVVCKPLGHLFGRSFGERTETKKPPQGRLVMQR